jgi:acyl carrier protein
MSPIMNADDSMNDIAGRLERCFEAIFPHLSPEQIRVARIESVPVWDSTSSVTLLAVVGEEFSISLDLDNLEELGSFEKIHAYLLSQIGNG